MMRVQFRLHLLQDRLGPVQLGIRFCLAFMMHGRLLHVLNLVRDNGGQTRLDRAGVMLAFQIPDGLVYLFRSPSTMAVIIVVGLDQKPVRMPELLHGDDAASVLRDPFTGDGRVMVWAEANEARLRPPRRTEIEKPRAWIELQRMFILLSCFFRKCEKQLSGRDRSGTACQKRARRTAKQTPVNT